VYKRQILKFAVAGNYYIYGAVQLFKVGGGNVADIEAAVDAILLDVTAINGNAMRGTDNAALATSWTAALATALAAYTAVRGGYLDELAAANLPSDIDDILIEVGGLGGDAMRGTDGAALVASGWDAGLATILDNFTAARIGYLDELDFDLQAALTAIQNEVDLLNGEAMRGTDSAALASVLGALADAAAQDADSVAFTAMQHLKGLHDVLWDDAGVAAWPAGAAPANGVSIAEAIRKIYDDVTLVLEDTGTTLENRQDGMDSKLDDIVCKMTFASTQDDNVSITAAQTNINLPSCVVADLPAGITIVRVLAYLKIQYFKDTYGNDNAINNADMDMAVDADIAYGSTVDAITIPDNSWLIDVSESTLLPGDLIIGEVDLTAEVTGNGTYYARLENAQADGANLECYGVQWGLMVYYTL